MTGTVVALVHTLALHMKRFAGREGKRSASRAQGPEAETLRWWKVNRAVGLFSLFSMISCVPGKTTDASRCYRSTTILNRQLSIPCDGSIAIDPNTGSEILVLPGASTSVLSLGVKASTLLQYYELFKLDSGTVIDNEYASITGQRVQGDSVYCIFLEHTMDPSVDFGGMFLVDVVEIHVMRKNVDDGLSVVNSIRDNNLVKRCGPNTHCIRTHPKSIASGLSR
jgi:hypothetical protein